MDSRARFPVQTTRNKVSNSSMAEQVHGEGADACAPEETLEICLLGMLVAVPVSPKATQKLVGGACSSSSNAGRGS